MLMLIDTHAHLDHPQFDPDREAVIMRASQAGVQTIINVGAGMASSRQSIALAEHYATVYATVGIHPHDAGSVTAVDLEALRRLAAHPRVVAIGEMGLDYYRDRSPRETQKAVLTAQLDIAAELDKPIVVHIRDKEGQRAAYEETLDILARWVSRLPVGRVGVLHCFSGDIQTAQMALDLGFYLGVDGPITYPNAGSLRALVARLPVDRLLLETDCPYLAPQFCRGRRNEPAYLSSIAAQVAEMMNVSAEQVAAITAENARLLFGLPA